MDRQTVYPGPEQLETDLLHAQQNIMIALAKLAADVLGSPVIANGFACIPTTPASLNVQVTAGEIYQLENLEATAWSSLPASTANSILKQGIQLNPVQFGITPPGTSGFSQVFLIEVQYQDLDTGTLTEPYFNAAVPTMSFAGPGPSGIATGTERTGVVAWQVKAGIAAATGTQVAPSADAGWTGLFTVTVANGASTITAANIATISNVFLPVTLPNVPAGVQAHSFQYAVDTGTASALVINANPDPTSYTAGLGFLVKAANAPTGASTLNVMGASGTLLGAVTIVTPNGAAIAAGQWPAGALLKVIHDGTHFQLVSITWGPAPQLPTFYSGSQTISVPVPYTRALVEMWAPTGGSGGVSVISGTANSAGTGAGGYLEKFLTGLTPGNTLVYTQGAAGTPGSSSPGNGGNGGTSTLASGTQTIGTLTCNGSVGTAGVSSNTATSGSLGGTATGGDINIQGQDGQNGSQAAFGYGRAGCTFFSVGADGVSATTSAGNPGTAGGLKIIWMP